MSRLRLIALLALTSFIIQSCDDTGRVPASVPRKTEKFIFPEEEGLNPQFEQNDEKLS